MFKIIKIKTWIHQLRISHWIKNLLVFFPIIFSNNLLNNKDLLSVTFAFFSFCFASSAVYIFNDIFDIEYDRHHIKKSKRPIASGQISLTEGKISILLMIILSLIISFWVNYLFTLIVILYFALNYLYSKFIKHYFLLDIILLVTLYLLRIFAGGAAIGIDISIWLIASTIFLSLALVFGKRKAELENVLIEKKTRKNIYSYNIKFLNLSLVVSLGLFFISYVMYSYFQQKYEFLFSIFFILMGILRYVYLIFKKNLGEEPERIIFDDPLLFILVILWLMSVFLVLYPI